MRRVSSLTGLIISSFIAALPGFKSSRSPDRTKATT